MIVIDASALVAIILKEEGWEDLLDQSDVFLSVDLVLKEASNAIWSAVFSNRLSKSEGVEAFSILKELFKGNILTKPQFKYLDNAFELALKHEITIYDSIYIAQALQESLPLLTLDQKQAKAARAEGVEVLP